MLTNHEAILALVRGLGFLACAAGLARAEFSTVINVPPDAPPTVIGSDTQVNVLTDGVLPDNVDAGTPGGTSSNVEVNINGGTVGNYFSAYGGSVVNLINGTVGHGFDAWNGSRINISGGRTGGGFIAWNGSEIVLTGGHLGQLVAYAGSTVTVDGGSIGSPYSWMGQRVGSSSGPTVLNLISGSISSSFEAHEHSILNISGGSLFGQFRAFPGSVVNMSGGEIGWFSQSEGKVSMSDGWLGSSFVALAGSEVSISGGTVDHRFEAHDGSTVQVLGGRIGSNFTAHDGSTVRIAGGAYGDNFQLDGGASAILVGNSFQLDGQPITGLGGIGSTLAIDIPAGRILSGVFADGTPFAFTSADGDVLADGVITLEVAELPAIGPTTITSSTDPVPLGIREGQTLIVDNGPFVRQAFVAGPGSTLIVEAGGSVDDYSKAIGAHVTINGGRIDVDFDAMLGSVVNLYDGELGHSADIYDGSVLNVAGGKTIGALRAKPGGVINVTSGEVNGITAEGGSHVAVSGGELTAAPLALAGAVLDVSGGVVQPGLKTQVGSSFRLRGGEFRLNGVPIGGLDAPGDTKEFDLPAGGVLTGVLADGAPIALAAIGQAAQLVSVVTDRIDDGVLTLVVTELPPIGPSEISLPSNPVPRGLRAGQTLVVGDGGIVPDRFTAIEGSTVRLLDGGQIRYSFEAVGAQIDILGGVLRGGAIYHGSVMNVAGGTVMSLFATESTEVDISSGIVRGLIAGSGSVVSISGGEVSGGGRGGPITVQNGASLSLTGHAKYSGLSVEAGGSITLSGGEIIDELDAAADALVHLIGIDFLFNGAPIPGFTAGTPFVLPDRGGVLSGTFVTGQSFEFELNDTNNVSRKDYFDVQATLTLTLIVPGDFNLDGSVDTADYELWRSGFGTADADFGTGADGNFNGKIDAADYVVWRRNLNRSISSASLQNVVPEPASIGLVLVICLASPPCRRRRKAPYLRRINCEKSCLPA